MSIVERMGAALAVAYGPNVEFGDQARAALRAIKPEDVSDAMVHEFYRIDRERLPYEDWMERARRAIAAAIAAGANERSDCNQIATDLGYPDRA